MNIYFEDKNKILKNIEYVGVDCNELVFSNNVANVFYVLKENELLMGKEIVKDVCKKMISDGNRIFTFNIFDYKMLEV